VPLITTAEAVQEHNKYTSNKTPLTKTQKKRVKKEENQVSISMSSFLLNAKWMRKFVRDYIHS
jgi:hypothetical protein